MLDYDCINYISLVEMHHVSIGRKKWQKRMKEIHKEYSKYRPIQIEGSDRYWEDDVQIIILTNGGGTNPNNSQSVYHRDINWRSMEDWEFNTSEEREKWIEEKEHISYIMITNVVRMKPTYCLVSPNHYYSVLYFDDEEFLHLKNIVV